MCVDNHSKVVVSSRPKPNIDQQFESLVSFIGKKPNAIISFSISIHTFLYRQISIVFDLGIHLMFSHSYTFDRFASSSKSKNESMADCSLWN